jgi:hypothetical protein
VVKKDVLSIWQNVLLSVFSPADTVSNFQLSTFLKCVEKSKRFTTDVLLIIFFSTADLMYSII